MSITVSAFNLTVKLVYQTLPMAMECQPLVQCDSEQLYFMIPEVVRFLAKPAENYILIEKAHDDIPDEFIHTWLFGTVFAYLLQYHGYVVLHGSAVLMNNQAVIFSGQSGAGKSTLARAMLQKGYSFITDDLVVIQQNHQQQYCILPGPEKLKLWKDTLQFFNHDITRALPVMNKVDKYAIPVSKTCEDAPMYPIKAFYELNVASEKDKIFCEELRGIQALKIIMQNAYRYFMLKPLGKLQSFFYDCGALSQQISVHQMMRTTRLTEVPQIIEKIESDQGILP